MTVGSATALRFNQAFFVLIGAGAALFSAGVLALEFAQYVLHVPGLKLHVLPWGWVLALVSIIIVSVVTMVVALRARDTNMLADMTGVRKRWPLGGTFIS